MNEKFAVRMSLTLVASASWMKWNDTENQVHARDIFKSGDEHKWFSELGDEDGADMTWKYLMLNISCETPALSREDQHQRTKKNVPKSVAHVRPLLCASYSLRVHSFFSPRKSISLHHNVLSLTTREHTKYIRSWKKRRPRRRRKCAFSRKQFQSIFRARMC